MRIWRRCFNNGRQRKVNGKTSGASKQAKRLDVVLIRPAKYDDDGYVIRHFRGVLPSNTLCCLYGLTEAVAESDRFAGRVDIHVHVHDETVDRVVPERIARRLRRGASHVLVGLVGVQTNQFPRAADLARRFVAGGCKVMIGGFHVSGSLAMSEGVPAECQELLDEGVTLVKGEVEDVWGDLLEDVVEDRMQPIYDIVERPALASATVPRVPAGYMRRFVYKRFGTIDTGRGCPFDCSFCTVINVQGRKMRLRSPEGILGRIRENYNRGKGIHYYILADDNVARNRYWEQLFDGLIHMREEEGMRIQFFMQVDVPAYRIPNFVRKAGEAGCSQVFVGVESLNPRNLEAACKRQNVVEDYAAMVEAWHGVGVHVHAAYIIGFPYDTYESIMADVDALAHELKFDQASFFMLTPLPGSRDHAEAVAAGVSMDGDLNRYDSYHAVVDHPNMGREQWVAAYREAWKRFYTPENMKEILLRSSVHSYWGMLKGFLWYRAGMIEGTHPMLTGFFRLKDRKERRPGCAIDPWWVHLRKRWREVRLLLREWCGLFFELQELWLQTRIPAENIRRLGAWREQLGEHLTELMRNLRSAQESIQMSVGNLRATLEQNIESLRSTLPSVSLSGARRTAGHRLRKTGGSWWRWLLGKINVLSVRGISTRRHLDRFWRETKVSLSRRAYWRINPILVFWNFLRDVRLSLSFTVFMLSERFF